MGCIPLLTLGESVKSELRHLTSHVNTLFGLIYMQIMPHFYLAHITLYTDCTICLERMLDGDSSDRRSGLGSSLYVHLCYFNHLCLFCNIWWMCINKEHITNSISCICPIMSVHVCVCFKVLQLFYGLDSK